MQVRIFIPAEDKLEAGKAGVFISKKTAFTKQKENIGN